MSNHTTGGSDTGAAFVGLIGGAIFIGAILYGIVIWTNKQFEGHEAEAKPTAYWEAERQKLNGRS